MKIHIITLPSRLPGIVAEINKHGLTAEYLDGITDGLPKHNISKSHKRIVQYAKDNWLPNIIIGEDDLRFFGEGAYKYFLDNMPPEYDLYLGSIYTGDPNEDNEVKEFRGLTIYSVSARYYDKFLGCSDTVHLDAALSMTGGKFVVCNPFIAFQEPGYSFQRKRYCDDSSRLKNRPIYGGK